MNLKRMKYDFHKDFAIDSRNNFLGQCEYCPLFIQKPIVLLK